MGKFDIDHLTGKLAIGTLIILAGAITIQSFADITVFIEWWTATKSYDFFFAIPFLFLSYLLGLITIRVTAIFFDVFRKNSIQDEVSRIVTVGISGSNFITNRYEQLLQEMELLQAVGPTTALLGLVGLLNIGLAMSFPYGKIVFGILGILLIAFLPFSLLLIARIRTEMKELAKQTGMAKTTR